jgi:hypothetical protein
MSEEFDQEKREAYYFYRKLMYALYVEIGALQPNNHPEIAAKADITNAFFRGEKQKQSAELYGLIENEVDLEKIEAPFRERTRLTLEDIHRAFAEGNWQGKRGIYYFGGPKWVKIAEATLTLRRFIENEEWEDAAFQVFKIKKLKTNQGNLINLFEWSDRRRT